MNIKNEEIRLLLAELCEPLTGSFLHKIEQVLTDTYVFTFRNGAKKFRLLVAVTPENSRVYIEPDDYEKRPLASFGVLLKKVLLRSYLCSISQVENDRILFLRFETSDGTKTLVFHLMGNRGNIFLLDGEKKVMARSFNRKGSPAPGEIYPFFEEEAKIEPVKGFAFNREVAERYREPAVEEDLSRLKSGLLKETKKRIVKIKKKLLSFEKETESLKKNAGAKEIGDILQTWFHRIEKGMSKIVLPDIVAGEGKEIEIELDPALDSSGNVGRYYKKYRRYEKGLERIKKDKITLKSELDRLNDKKDRIEKLRSYADFLPYMSPAAVASKNKKKPDKKKSPIPGRKFISTDGHAIYVGRSDAENDQLTRMANGRDIWLHARDYPGSHVLIRIDKGKKVEQKTLEEGAMLALNYSKAANAGKGEVTFCEAKYVRKPKGFKPGKVLVNDPKNIHVRIDKEKIGRMKEKSNE